MRPFLEEAFDGDFDADDFAHALGGRHFWLADVHGLVAHASLVPRLLVCDGRALLSGYVEAVATRKASRDAGLASTVMREVGDVLTARYELGALSSNADRLYERLGWERWRGPTGVVRDLSAIAGGWDPTPDDDGGVFTLRTPRTPMLAIDSRILCEARDGDVW